MTRIGFLGLGRMGAPMAERLAKAGHDLAVWNRTAHRAATIAASAPLTVATSAQDAVTGRDLVITMLSDRRAVAEVLGPLKVDAGTTVVEMSTTGPDAVRSLRRTLPSQVGLIDAPVLGSIPQVNAGELHIFVGGSQDEVARCQDVLAVLGQVEHCGPLGAGAAMKLVVNLANLTAIVALGESLGLARVLDVDRDSAFDALARTALGKLVGGLRGRIEDPASPVVFDARLAVESLRLVLEAGALEAGVVGGALRQLSEHADQERDISAVIRAIATGPEPRGA
ncbi:NAD(P)-dependent oxidoreductase [Lentzea sp. NEAU-D7]|uniref:NAD(P)-dependent oxidoreductase n=1 Tax=Lentzea sp. NEAU-D7 TaxID=2994667 RepID=UPI00224B9DFA|nr:NAD(P)-dependent oxidoreductase [Lentzea sp. NEAU-D7]MCX2950185.1 NAD(P)-dependent oxidoreductase [Lentzea sp. NEAU-D7]